MTLINKCYNNNNIKFQLENERKQYKYNFMLYLFLFIYFKDREKKQLSQKLLDTITIKNATTVTCKKKKMFHNPFLISTG